MASIIATITAREGQETALEALLRALVQSTAAEPGALVYDLQKPEGSKTVFVVTERYRDEAARTAHLASSYLKETFEKAAPYLAGAPEVKLLQPVVSIKHQGCLIKGKPAELVVLPIGSIKLVYVKTDKGVLGCGALDPAPFGRFGIPVARVKLPGRTVEGLEDLLAAEVSESNPAAQALGIHVGMTGDQALSLL